MDVLENGPSSRYTPYFDVDWDPPEAYLRNLVLMPILGEHYGEALEAGDIRLERDGGTFHFRYHEHRLPVAPRSLGALLIEAGHRARSDDLLFIGESSVRLPPATATDRTSMERRHRNKEILRRQLARLAAEDRAVAGAIDAVIAETNANIEALDHLLDGQNYRLAHWRAAERDLGYRRFFDVTTLIGLRMEDRAVFDDVHALVVGWLDEGVIDGLRVDHPDGLRDPTEYFRRLRAASPKAWIVAEKILEPGETLPDDWPVDGTTGYDFLGLVGGLWVDGRAETEMTRIYGDFTGRTEDIETEIREAKQLVLRDVLGSELNRLTALLLDICEGHRRYRDYTRHDCHEVLRELAVAMPVYRTYIRPGAGVADPRDITLIEGTVRDATDRRPDIESRLFDFVGDILSLRVEGEREHELAARFQQLTGAVMAKGVEDTAFYRYHRLVSLNEVGGDPGTFGTTVDAFHAANADRLAHWPDTMLATTTHDTKRSEDTRLRIHLLSEIPERWRAAVSRWSGMLAHHQSDGLPDANLEYLLYQTLVGTWPIGIDRLEPYLRKAVREAKVRTTWAAADATYEAAVEAFTSGALTDAAFVADLERFLEPLAPAARIASLGQTLFKLTVPGVPDIYQGTELWDHSLVDPDNRRPVDFGARRRMLKGLASATAEDVMAAAATGLPKLWTIARTLDVRRRSPDTFGAAGAYLPLSASGAKADHVVAFGRGDGPDVVAVSPRLVLGLRDGWDATTLDLPRGSWRNALTDDPVAGGAVGVAELLARFPVALLVRDQAAGR